MVSCSILNLFLFRRSLPPAGRGSCSTCQRNRVNRIVDSCSRPSAGRFHVEFRNDLLIGTVLACGFCAAEVRVQGEAGIRPECDPSFNGDIRWTSGGLPEFAPIVSMARKTAPVTATV